MVKSLTTVLDLPQVQFPLLSLTTPPLTSSVALLLPFSNSIPSHLYLYPFPFSTSFLSLTLFSSLFLIRLSTFNTYITLSLFLFPLSSPSLPLHLPFSLSFPICFPFSSSYRSIFLPLPLPFLYSTYAISHSLPLSLLFLYSISISSPFYLIPFRTSPSSSLSLPHIFLCPPPPPQHPIQLKVYQECNVIQACVYCTCKHSSYQSVSESVSAQPPWPPLPLVCVKLSSLFSPC